MSIGNKIGIFFAKREFLAKRGDMYAELRANFTESGSGKVSTTLEVFNRWAARSNSRRESVGLAYRQIALRLEKGASFSEAIGPYIPKMEALIIEAGDASGRLPQALEAAELQKYAGSEIGGMVTAAMAEPAMSVATILATGYFCGLSLWPEMLRVVDEKFWPKWALPMIHWEIGLAKHWQYLALVFVVAGFYLWSIPYWTGTIRSYFDKVPPWSIYRDRQAAALLGVLGGLLSSGMELDAALARIQRSVEPWLAWHISKIRHQLVFSGANPMKAFNTGLFSLGFLDLIEDAASNRSFDDTLVHISSTALPIILKRVKVMVASTAAVMSLLTGILFAYQIGVQQSGVNDAMQSFSSHMQSGKN